MALAAGKHASGTAVRRRYKKKAPPMAAFRACEEQVATACARECSGDLLELLAAGAKRRRVCWTRGPTAGSAQTLTWGQSREN